MIIGVNGYLYDFAAWGHANLHHRVPLERQKWLRATAVKPLPILKHDPPRIGMKVVGYDDPPEGSTWAKFQTWYFMLGPWAAA